MTVDPDLLDAHLSRLKLTAIRDQLDTLLDEAARKELNLREALAFLCAAEVARKDQRRIRMATAITKFPAVRTLDGFDPRPRIIFRRALRTASSSPPQPPGTSSRVSTMRRSSWTVSMSVPSRFAR